MPEADDSTVADSGDTGSYWINIYSSYDGPDSAVRVELREAAIVVGRGNPRTGEFPDLDLRAMGIPDARTVAWKHCRFVRIAEGYTVEDLRAMAGTYVNDEQITWSGAVPLRSGDRVGVGKIILEYTIQPPER